MTDHDQQATGGGHSNYGEAVGVVRPNGFVATPSLYNFAESLFRLFGQYFRGTMATPMQRSGSEDLAKKC